MKQSSFFRISFSVIMIFLLSFRLYGQQDQYFVQIDSTEDGHFSCAMRDTSTGDFLCIHNTIGNLLNGQMMMLDTTGAVQWIKNYSVHGGAFDMIRCSDGDYILGGQQTVSTNNVIYLWKITPQGNSVWYRQIAEGSSSTGYSLAPSYDGGCVITGASTSSKFFFIRVNGSGIIVMQKNLSINIGPGGYCHGLTRTADSCYIGGIFANVAADNSDVWIYKFDTAGTVLWLRAFDSMHGSEPMWIIPAYDGGYIICGKSSATNSSANKNPAIWRTDSAGHLLWSKCYPRAAVSIVTPFDIQEMPDHGIMIFCTESSVSTMVRTDSAGNLRWTKQLNNNLQPGGRATISNDVIYLTGHYHYNAVNVNRPSFVRLKDDTTLFCSVTHPSWLEIPFSCTESSPTYPVQTPSFTNNLVTITFTTPVTPPVRTLICENLITGESEMDNGNSVSVYPNPGTNIVFLHCERKLTSASFVVTEINGSVIERKENVNGNDMQIDVTGWASGIYFFSICGGDGEILTGKLMVTRDGK
ncbi:MAG TPA: T9SS type A sorting domain-containing protein [Bacteroidia bacterium]|jgi:hypothetical protein|nr:T9SS type A sorting domain-containing protein [Bacteroidia bacterium]